MSLLKSLPVSGLCLVACLCLTAQVKLKTGSITLAATDLSQASCVQIPIFIEEASVSGKDIVALDITIAISGDIAMIDGGITTNMFVTTAFTGSDLTGITNPGTELVNADKTPTPTCGVIFNQAVQGGPEVSFEGGSGNGLWFVNNDGQMMDYKSGFVLTFSPVLVTTVPGQEMLAAILEIPLVANPGVGTLTLTPVVGEAINFFQWDDGANGLLDEAFDLSSGPGALNICPQAIVSQPQSVLACPGDDVNFSVNLTGPGPISYQWRKDEVPINGATSATLSLTNVGAADLASYDCIISSSCANETTASATLSFGEATLSISPSAAVLGLNTLSFSAMPLCETAPVSYEWRDEDDNIIGTTDTLTLDPPPAESAFYYLTMTDAAPSMIQLPVGVLVNPNGLDLNGDGFNTLDDLLFLVESWNMASVFDVDGDNILTIADMMYINTGH